MRLVCFGGVKFQAPVGIAIEGHGLFNHSESLSRRPIRQSMPPPCRRLPQISLGRSRRFQHARHAARYSMGQLIHLVLALECQTQTAQEPTDPQTKSLLGYPPAKRANPIRLVMNPRVPIEGSHRGSYSMFLKLFSLLNLVSSRPKNQCYHG